MGLGLAARPSDGGLDHVGLLRCRWRLLNQGHGGAAVPCGQPVAGRPPKVVFRLATESGLRQVVVTGSRRVLGVPARPTTRDSWCCCANGTGRSGSEETVRQGTRRSPAVGCRMLVAMNTQVTLVRLRYRRIVAVARRNSRPLWAAVRWEGAGTVRLSTTTPTNATSVQPFRSRRSRRFGGNAQSTVTRQ